MVKVVRGKKVDCSVLVTGRGTDDGLIALRRSRKGASDFANRVKV